MRLSRKARLWVSTLGAAVIPMVVDVSGVQGFWAVLAVCMGTIAWSLFFFRGEISRIRVLSDQDDISRIERPFWLILPGIAMLLVALYPFMQLYMAASGYIKPLTFDDLLQNYIHDRSLYVTGLARIDSRVRDKTFERVTFVGPAVITLGEANVMTDNTFSLAAGGKENLFWEIPPGKLMVGGIIFHNCSFRYCQFVNVQFVGTKEMLDELRPGVMEK